MKRILLTLGLLLGLSSAAAAQTFDCSGGFATTGACGLNLTWEYKGTPFKIIGADSVQPKLDGTKLILYPTGLSHRVANLIYQTKVSVKSFTTKFVFVPNGTTIAFNFNNATVPAGYGGKEFAAGAGCEAGFYQGYGAGNNPNNVFALDFDSASALNPYGNSPWDYTYSSAQIYQSNQPPSVYPNTLVQCPCTGGSTVCGDNSNPNVGNHQITKLSTYPVPLTNPASTAGAATGDTYSAVLNYDGNDLILDLADETKGGEHYTHTWSNTDIPNSVGADTAWVGIVATSNGATSYPLYVNSWTYGKGGGDVPTPVPSPSSTPTNQPTPIPPGNGACTFTSPNGDVTFQCSPAVSLLGGNPMGMMESHRVAPPPPEAGLMSGPGILTRPAPTSTSTPPPSGNGVCSLIMPSGTASWSCQ